MDSLKKLEDAFAAAGLTELFGKLKEKARNAVVIETELCDHLPKGSSRIGGTPDLPEGVEWPTGWDGQALSFVAQFDLSDVCEFDSDGVLPGAGCLYFFYDAVDQPWGLEPEERSGQRVIYFDGGADELAPQTSEAQAFPQLRLTFEARAELPSFQSDLFPRELSEEEIADGFGLWARTSGALAGGSAGHQLLGHSKNIQGGMESSAEARSRELSVEDERDSSTQEDLQRQAKRWRLLFQLDSSEDGEMIWGDVGAVYWWISEDDLMARCFDRTVQFLQCM